jgi:hypothetical protein
MKIIRNLMSKTSGNWKYLFVGTIVIFVIVGLWRFVFYEKHEPFNQDELAANKQDLGSLYGQMEVRLSATEQQLKHLENQLALQKKDTNQRIEPFKRKMTNRIDELDKKVEKQVNQLRSETTKKVDTVEQKMNKIDKRKEQIQSAMVDSVIKKEVSEQVTMLRKEAQQREKEKQKKKLLNHFLDQLAKENTDSAD